MTWQRVFGISIIMTWALLATAPVFAACGDPMQPTCTPTPMPTITPTPSPTLDLYQYVTVIPPDASSDQAQAGAVEFEIDAGQALIMVLLFLLLLLKLFEFVGRQVGNDTAP